MLLDIFYFILDLINEFFISVSNKHTESGMGIPLPILLVTIFIASLWILSGCWASSIADMRKRDPVKHFIGGLVLPFFYPLYIMFTLDVKGATKADIERQKEEKQKKEEEEAERKKKEKKDMERMLEERSMSTKYNTTIGKEIIYDTNYFKQIMLDDEGNPTGPWRLVYDGNEVEANFIIDVLEIALVIDVGPTGKNRKIRVPYHKIEIFEPL